MIRQAVIGEQGQRFQLELEGQRLDIEWLRLIPKPRGGRDQGAVQEAVSINPVEARAPIAQPNRRLMCAGGQRALHQEWSEAVARTFDRPERRIQTIAESSWRRAHRRSSQLEQQEPRDGIACCRRSPLILNEITGGDGTIREQKRQGVADRLLCDRRPF